MKTTLNIFFALMLMMLSSCANGSQAEAKTPQTKNTDKVEVMYFHGKYRCATCKAIGTFSKEVVDQLGNSSVIWKEVDLSTPEGEKLGDKYEVVGSGLVVAKGKKWTDLTEMGFKYALADTPKFKNELKSEIQKIKK